MFKAAATKIALFAFTPADGLPKTGDAANITMYVSKDYGSVTGLTDTSATELDNTNAKGWYLCDVSGTEATADALLFTGKSSTSGVILVSQYIFTTPASFTSFVTPTGAAVNATQIGSQTASAAGTVTFPGTVASATNITAGTITTVTNLTNAPTAGDLTATMKTSVTTAATAATPTALLTVGTGTGQVNLSGGAVPIKGNIKKAAAYAGFTFMMTDSTNHNPLAGLSSLTATRSLDGVSFSGGTLSAVSAVGSGIYSIDFASGDTTANTIILRVTATGADDTFVRIVTYVA